MAVAAAAGARAGTPRFLRSSLSRPRVQVGRSDAPEERAANAATDAALKGAEPVARGLSAAPAQGVPGLGTGAPLEKSVRRRLERGLGGGLAGVRIHCGEAAARSAARVGAEAYALGSDLVFGAGRFRPGTADGERLLTHEAAHALLCGGSMRVIRRSEPPAAAGEWTPPEPGTLPNEQLLAELVAVRRWLGEHAMVEIEHGRRADHLERLEEEREARVLAGQVWMADDVRASVPLFRLEPAGEALAVVPAPEAAGAHGGNGLVFTFEQLERSAARHGIPTLPVESAVAGVMSSGIHQRAEYAGFSDVFARRTNPNTLRSGFPGAIGEYMYAARTPAEGGARVDLNTVPWRQARGPAQRLGSSRTGAFPVWDYLEPDGRRISIKVSAQDRAGRFSYYDGGYSDLTGGGAFDQAVYNRDPSLRWPPGGSMTPAETAAWEAARQQAVLEGRLAVNADDVVTYRDTVADRLAGDPAGNRRVLDAFLAASPEPHGGATLRSLADIQALPAAEQQAVLRRVAQRIARTQVVSNRVTTGGIEGFKGDLGRPLWGLDPSGTGTAPRPDIVARAWPEYMAVREFGYMGAGVRAAPRGAALGGPAAVALDAGGYYWSHGELPPWERMAESGVSGTAGGALGAAVETGAQARTAQLLAQRGITATGAVTGARALGGGVAGGIAAPVVELGMMAYHDVADPAYDPTAADYAGRGGRALVVGGLSGALAAGGTMALVGTTVGPAGTAVGFVLGVGAYLLTDYLIGDSVESMVRSRF